MSDRFRELESPRSGKIKDAVLMATVSGLDGLRQPRMSDFKQFAELFEPLFASASDEARRQAAAALSRSPHVPSRIALQIASSPIGTAAVFLTRCATIDDQTLITIIRSQSQAHATAIARRDNLSARVVDALVERRQTGLQPAAEHAPVPVRLPVEAVGVPVGTAPVPPLPSAATADIPAREEALRDELKALARRGPPKPAKVAIVAATPTIEALLARFARSGEVNLFAATLSVALDCPPTLGERIVLDISGQQLAMALVALGVERDTMAMVLSALYPHLGERHGGGTRGDQLLAAVDPRDAQARTENWIASETSQTGPHLHEPFLAPVRPADPRPAVSPQHQQGNFPTIRRTVGRTAR